MIFGLQFGIITGSWISFLLTGFLDAILFAKIKEWTKGKYIWVRSVLSDIPMLALDSFIFVTLAFGVFQGDWAVVWPTITGQIFTKWIFGVVDTPFIYLDRFIVYKFKKDKIIAEKERNKDVS